MTVTQEKYSIYFSTIITINHNLSVNLVTYAIMQAIQGRAGQFQPLQILTPSEELLIQFGHKPPGLYRYTLPPLISEVLDIPAPAGP